MGLGPAPRELKLVEWGRPYGKLPSDFKPEDYRWLALAERYEQVRRLNDLLENNPKQLPKDAALYIFELRKEVRQSMEELSKDDDKG